MSERFTVARLTRGGEKFEILVRPESALDFKLGKPVATSRVLAIEEVYSDAGKGTRASAEKLQKLFGSTNPLTIAEEIMKSGELQLTTEQRRQLIEDKKKQIISFISRNCIDPRTGAPHPPIRVEQAFSQVRLSIDPFKPAEEQARQVIEEIRPILPLKMEQVKIEVRLGADHSRKAYGVLKNFGTFLKEEWSENGSLMALLEMPAGMYGPFVERLGKISQGTVQTRILK